MPPRLKGFIVSDAPAEAAKPPKSKKMLIIIVAAVLLLGGGGAAAFFILKSKSADTAEAAPVHAHPAAPPTFLPLEAMVVNLADPGGDRFAQIGITLEISDAHVADQVKAFMPSIRNGILLAISQRTTTELLQVEGKQKLAKDILREVSKPLGYEVEDEDAPAEEDEAATAAAKKKAKAAKPAKKHEENPIKNVLFSSFIVQ